MQQKTILYIDVDDTLIAECYPGSGFDLRPGVCTQLSVLSRLFECHWLTYWPEDAIMELFEHLYGYQLIKDFTYCRWQTRMHANHGDKVDAVLEGPPDWYWLEDPLPREELKKLEEAGKLDRYIPVAPKGPDGFLDGIHELFRRKGIEAKQLLKVGADPFWFDKPPSR